MKILLSIIFLSFLVVGPVEAKVLKLHSGRTVEGNVVEETDDYYLLEVDGGFMMTYYKDDVAEAVENWTDLSVEEGASSSDAMAELENTVYDIVGKNESKEADPDKFSSTDVQLTDKERKLIADMDKRDLVLRFMDVFGTRATLKASYQQMLTQLTPEQVEEVKNSITVESIVEQLIPLYERYFTTEELRKYITFYSSIEGRKLLRTVPVLMQESVKTSIEYFERAMPSSVR